MIDGRLSCNDAMPRSPAPVVTYGLRSLQCQIPEQRNC